MNSPDYDMESSLPKTVTLNTVTANTYKLAQGSLIHGNCSKWLPVSAAVTDAAFYIHDKAANQRSILHGVQWSHLFGRDTNHAPLS